jgi:hypothetical protein
MSGVRLALLALLACLAMTGTASVACANPAPPPDIWKREAPENGDDTGQQPSRTTARESRRSGPFRSCGSGMGVGLAGIGLAWGFMWIGNRYAGRVAGRREDDPRD